MVNQDVKIFNNEIKLDHSLEFASVLKIWWRVWKALFIHVHGYKKKNKKKSVRLKSRFALKIVFIERRKLWKLNLQEPCELSASRTST